MHMYVSSLERKFPQNAELLIFEGVHKYNLSYSISRIQYTLLAFWARKVYRILDSKFTQGRTYCKLPTCYFEMGNVCLLAYVRMYELISRLTRLTCLYICTYVCDKNCVHDKNLNGSLTIHTIENNSVYMLGTYCLNFSTLVVIL